jgi:hypothetical protein
VTRVISAILAVPLSSWTPRPGDDRRGVRHRRHYRGADLGAAREPQPLREHHCDSVVVASYRIEKVERHNH